MALQTVRQVSMTGSQGETFTIDITFDDVKVQVTQIAWANTGGTASVTLSQPGKPTITKGVAGFGQTPTAQQLPSSGSVNVPTNAGGYTYDPTGDNVNAAQLSATWSIAVGLSPTQA